MQKNTKLGRIYRAEKTADLEAKGSSKKSWIRLAQFGQKGEYLQEKWEQLELLEWPEWHFVKPQ